MLVSTYQLKLMQNQLTKKGDLLNTHICYDKGNQALLLKIGTLVVMCQYTSNAEFTAKNSDVYLLDSAKIKKLNSLNANVDDLIEQPTKCDDICSYIETSLNNVSIVDTKLSCCSFNLADMMKVTSFIESSAQPYITDVFKVIDSEYALISNKNGQTSLVMHYCGKTKTSTMHMYTIVQTEISKPSKNVSYTLDDF